MEKKKKILVTGGGSGIGRAITERFYKEGHTVIACGRRKDVLDNLALEYPGLATIQCDLENIEERDNLFQWVLEHHTDLNVLVNNAGIQNWMAIDDKDFFLRTRKEIAINIEAPLHLTSLFIHLPSLDTIMNVTSGLSFAPLAKVPVYSATKAFLHSFTLSIRYLLQGRGIDVIEIIPPALNTDLGGKGIHDFAPPVHEFIEAIFDQLRQDRKELTFGFSDAMVKAGPNELKAAFARMNP